MSPGMAPVGPHRDRGAADPTTVIHKSLLVTSREGGAAVLGVGANTGPAWQDPSPPVPALAHSSPTFAQTVPVLLQSK